MPFIGNQPALSYTSFAKQDFTTSATTSYTLDHPVTNENEIALFINFVRQEPTTAYTASGTTLTLTSATSASDDMYCVFLGKAVQTVNPPSGSVGLSQLTATGTKDATTFLRGDNSFAVPAGGTNTPAFQAYLSSDQTITELADVKIQFDTEFFDTDNCYDNTTNYRFTPNVAGKYLVYTSMRITASADSDMRNTLAMFYKNGSRINYFGTNYRNGNCRIAFCAGSMIVDMNGSSDYLEILAFADTVSGNNPFVDGGSADHAIFGAYKIIE